MRKIMIGLAALVFLPLYASFALAQTTGHTTANVNLRAGPGTNYPSVTTVPKDAPITVYGCQTGYDWCDTSWGPTRGWIQSNYILIDADSGQTVLTPTLATSIGISIIVFNQANYWNLYYTHYPWYATWYHRTYPVHPVHPVHPLPGPYCYHAPQAPECRYLHPYQPYHPYYHPYTHPYHPYTHPNHPYHPYHPVYGGGMRVPHGGGFHGRVR